MSAEAWIWAGTLSVLAFVMGWRTGVGMSARVFAKNLVRYGLMDIYVRRSQARTPDQERHP